MEVVKHATIMQAHLMGGVGHRTIFFKYKTNEYTGQSNLQVAKTLYSHKRRAISGSLRRWNSRCNSSG